MKPKHFLHYITIFDYYIVKEPTTKKSYTEFRIYLLSRFWSASIKTKII